MQRLVGIHVARIQENLDQLMDNLFAEFPT
jgi:hypothetical protein